MKINPKKLLFYVTYIPGCCLIGILIFGPIAIVLPEDEPIQRVCADLLAILVITCVYLHGILGIIYFQYLLAMKTRFRRLILWCLLVMVIPVIVCPILYRRHRSEFEGMLMV